MATSEYRIDVHAPAPSGVIQAQIDGSSYTDLKLTRQVNAAGFFSFSINTNHPAFNYIVNDAVIVIWRRNVTQGLNWYVEFTGLVRLIQREYTDRDSLNVSGAGILSLLARRHVLFYANTSNRSVFVSKPAETIMKTLVEYNAAASATTGNSRLRDGEISGVTVQANSGLGNTISLACAYDNLLSVLQFISSTGGGGGDFDLVRTSDTAYEFRWYTGQLGTDRTASITFALEYGNMGHPIYTVNRFDQKTVAIVGGQGQDSSRAIAVRTGSEYATGIDIETFVDGRNEATTATLESKGDIALDTNRNKITSFSFDVLQIPSYFYGQHYFLGDLVSYRYTDIAGTIKIIGITITVDNESGNESIQVDMLSVD